jgi:hypothetical protein
LNNKSEKERKQKKETKKTKIKTQETRENGPAQCGHRVCGAGVKDLPYYGHYSTRSSPF